MDFDFADTGDGVEAIGEGGEGGGQAPADVAIEMGTIDEDECAGRSGAERLGEGRIEIDGGVPLEEDEGFEREGRGAAGGAVEDGIGIVGEEVDDGGLAGGVAADEGEGVEVVLPGVVVDAFAAGGIGGGCAWWRKARGLAGEDRGDGAEAGG